MGRRDHVGDEGIDEMEDESGVEQDGRNEVAGRER